MSSASRWASAILAPSIAFFASAGWYLARTVSSIYLIEGGSSVEDMGGMRITHSVVGMLGLALGGGIAIATGPWVPLILGAGALSVGLFALAALPVDAAPIALGLAAFGHAMILPALYGALARALDGELEGLRNAAFLVVAASINAGAFMSPLFGSEIRAALGFRTVFLTGGGIAVVALVLAGILGAVVLMTRKKEPSKSEPAPAGGWARAGVGGGVVVVCALPWALAIGAGAWELLAPELRYGLSEVESTTLHALNPLVVIALSLLGAVAFVVLHALKAKVPALLIAGLGLAVLGVGAALSAALIDEDASLVTVGAVLVIGAIGEALFLPLLLSRATADLPLRLETAVAAAWILAIRVIMMLTAFVSDEPSGQRALLWVGALAALVVGIGLAAASFPLRRVFALEPASGSLPSAPGAG